MRSAYFLHHLAHSFIPAPVLTTARPGDAADHHAVMTSLLATEYQTWSVKDWHDDFIDEDDTDGSLFLQAHAGLHVSFTSYPGYRLDSCVFKADVVLAPAKQ